MKRLTEILIILMVCCMASFLLVLRAANNELISAAQYQALQKDTSGIPGTKRSANVYPPAIPGQPVPDRVQPALPKNNKQPLTLPDTNHSNTPQKNKARLNGEETPQQIKAQ